MDRFFIKSFGCRASQADGAALEARLEARGPRAASATADAHPVVLNKFTETSTADDELRQVVRRIHSERPEARILATGCYAQRVPEEIAGPPGVTMVVGNPHKAGALQVIA